MPEVSRELSNKLQVTELSWRALISALLESIWKRLVICKDDKGAALDHMSEVLDVLIHCQELTVLRTVLLLRRDELMGVESQGLPSVADTLLQGGRIAASERSVNKANVADGSGWARSVARERLGFQSSKAWTMVGVQATGCDPLTLGPANAVWTGACMLAACGMNRR
jgi:hypothetical protein